MADLKGYVEQAEKVALLIDDLMLDELRLAAPAEYRLEGQGENVYLIGSYNPLQMGRSLRVYEHPEVARRLRMVTALPVTITKDTGTRYVVLLKGSIALPRAVQFPGMHARADVFRLGVSWKGEICRHADKLQNVMIGASQGKGKSVLLELLSYQMHAFGWSLFLADPQYHTFNPDIWDGVASMPVAGSQEAMLRVIDAIETELSERAWKFRQAAAYGKPPRDLAVYNEQAVKHGFPELPRMGLISDESNFYLGDKRIFSHMAELLREGRKFGLHVVIAAHEWHKETIPASVNDLLQTRIALASLSGAVVLRSHQWGKWVEGRRPGLGVLRMSSYQPVQFYMIGEDARIELPEQVGKICPLSEREAALVRRSLGEAAGKFTGGLLVSWGLSDSEARKLAEEYETRGWLVRGQDNARFVSQTLVDLVEEFFPNHQTAQTAQTSGFTLPNRSQTGAEPVPKQI